MNLERENIVKKLDLTKKLMLISSAMLVAAFVVCVFWINFIYMNGILENIDRC